MLYFYVPYIFVLYNSCVCIYTGVQKWGTHFKYYKLLNICYVSALLTATLEGKRTKQMCENQILFENIFEMKFTRTFL